MRDKLMHIAERLGFEVQIFINGLILAVVVLYEAYVIYRHELLKGQRPDLVLEAGQLFSDTEEDEDGEDQMKDKDRFALTTIAIVAIVGIVAIFAMYFMHVRTPVQVQTVQGQSVAQTAGAAAELDVYSLKGTDGQPLILRGASGKVVPERPKDPAALPEEDKQHWWDIEYAGWKVDKAPMPESPKDGPKGKSVVLLKAGKQVKTIPVKREPVAATITPDGKFLYVANHLPDGRADLDYVASKLSVIDTAKAEVTTTINLVNGAEGMRGVSASPDGQFIYATHLMARFQVPTTQIEHGWINTSALSVIRVADQKLLYTVLLDDIYLGFANPWAVETSTDGKLLCVSSAGTHELRLIDLPAMTEKINEAVSAMGEDAEAMHLNAHNDLTFMSGVSRRVQLKGIGPRAMVIAGKTIYATEYFSDSLAKVTPNEAKTSLSRHGAPIATPALCSPTWSSTISEPAWDRTPEKLLTPPP